MRFAIDDLVLCPEALELRRSGRPVAIEPKILDLMLFLVEHRARIVSKEELVEHVWQRRHISDSALTRGIYEARRILGDDAKRQGMIKTVYRRGYQFVGPVQIVPAEAAGTTANAAFAGPTAEGGNGGGDGAPAPEATATPAEPRPRSRRRPRSQLWAAGLAVLLLSTLAWWLRATGRSAPAIGAPARHAPIESLAVLPIELDDADPDLRLMALSIADQITVRFSAQPGLTVRSFEYSQAVAATDREAYALPQALLQDLRVQAALAGRLSPTAAAGRHRLSLDLLVADPAAAARRVHVGVYELKPPETAQALEDFLRTREAIAEDVLEHLSPKLTGWSPDETSPTHPEALRLYLEARRRFATISCGDASALIAGLDRALELDPGFSVAWVAKGFALYSESWSCGRDASYAERALEAVRESRRLTPSLSGALLLETILLTERGDAEQAFAGVLAFERASPPSAASRYAAAYALRYAGLLEASKAALEESLELDPLVLREFATAPVTLLYRGELDAFLAHLPAEETPHDRYYRGLAMVSAGREGAALEVLSPALELNPTDLFARYASALHATLEGRSEDALGIVRGVVHQRQRLGTQDGEMTFKEAQLLAFAGDAEGAARRLDEAVDAGFFCPRCLQGQAGLELSGLEALPGRQETLERAARRHRAFAARFGLPAEF